jgi:hypothetical protein
MNIYNIIKEEYVNLLNETFSINNIPSDIKKLLDGYDLFMDFDWNKKQDEFNGQEFKNWFDNYQSEQLILKIDKIISKVRQDIILLNKRKLAKKKLDAFEELIIPVLDNSVLVPKLSKFTEYVLLDPNATAESITKGFNDAKNIFNIEGDIDIDKVTQSQIFKNDIISLPGFQKFAKNNPEYRGVYNDWEKIFNEDIELTLKDTHTSQIVSIDNLKKLYKYLIDLKNKIK